MQLKLSVPDSHQDLIVGPLAALGFEGFLQDDGELSAYVHESKWDRTCEVRLRHYLRNFSREFPRLKLHVSRSLVRQQDWNRTWERSIGIVEAAPGIVIKPSWRNLRARDKGKIVLRIDPKMSFGTGHHETTRLCLRLLREYIRPGMSVLDFGSGTGILATASIKLGARRALAIDHDAWTIPNIKENLKRNRIEKRVRVILGSAASIPSISFDLVVANIDLPTITEVHPHFIKRLSKGGILILSGLLTTDLLPLHKLISHKGLSPLDIAEENEWAALALVRI